MASPTDRNPDVVVAAFLAALATDRAAGAVRGLPEYQQRYPGYEDELAQAWASLDDHAVSEGADTQLDANPGECPPGSRFAGYEVRSVLGRGGQAVVYDAFDQAVGRAVALKVLHQSRLWSPDARRRFAREVEVTTRLEHPGICPVYARGFENGTPWIAMRRLQGQSLAGAVAQMAAADWRDAVGVVLAASRAIAHAHALGVVHRDLKPGNLWLDEQGRAVVLDFGLASDREPEGHGEALTRSGDLFGTIGYMAPEQLAGAGAVTSPRTDVFALGVILFELLSGTRPFPSATFGSYERALTLGPPDVRTARRGLPRELGAVLRVAMASDPGERYVDADALVADLEAVLAGRTIVAVPPGPMRRFARWVARERALAASLAALLVVTALGLAAVFRALDRAQANAARSAITAANALVRSQQADAARDALARCPEEHRGFAYRLLRHQLRAGSRWRATEPPEGTPMPRQLHGSRQGDGIHIRHAGRDVRLPQPRSKWLAAYSDDLSHVAVETVLGGGGGVQVAVTDAHGGALATWHLQERDVTAMEFAPDTGWLWCAVRRTGARGSQLLQAYGIGGREKLYEQEISGGKVTALLALAGHRLVLGHEDGLVQVVEPAQRSRARLCWHRSKVVELRPTPDGVLSRDEDGHRRHWCRSVRGAARVLDAGPGPVHALTFRGGSVETATLEVWSRTGPKLVWQPIANELVGFGGPRSPAVPEPTLVARHPSEDLTITGRPDGTVLLRMGDGNGPIATVTSGAAAVTCVAFAGDGEHFAVGHDDGMVAAFSLEPWLPASAAVDAAKQRADEELASIRHVWELPVAAGVVPTTWHELERRRLSQRRIGTPLHDLQHVLYLAYAARPLQELTARILDRRMQSLSPPSRAAGVSYAALMAHARLGRFGRLERLLTELPAGQHATRPLWRTVAAILRGDPGAGPVPAIGLHPMVRQELDLRLRPGGADALRRLDEQFRQDPRLPPPEASPALQLSAAGVSSLVAPIQHWSASSGLPADCYSCLLYWARKCVASPAAKQGALSVGAHAALLAAAIRCGVQPDIEAASAYLLASVDDWRDLDPLAAAFLALGHPEHERARWVDRAEAAAMLRGASRSVSLRLLLREAR